MTQAAAIAGPAPVTWRTLVGFIAMVFGMFMALLDIQIVASSLNEIQAGLAASPDEVSWVQTAYLVAEIVMIPLSGFLARALSTRVVFTASCAAFTVASLLCATASDLDTMLVFRAFQGFVGGAMIPSVFSTAFTAFPKNRQGPLSAMIGLIATLAATLGPSIGGYLTQVLSWHWLFLINVGPGVVVSATVWLLIDLDRPQLGLFRNFDAIGLVLLAGFLGSLEYVVDEGTRNDWLADPTIRDFTVVTIVSGILFFWRELTFSNPVVALRVFTNRNFSAGCLVSLVLGTALYGLVYMLPLYLGRIRGLNSLQIGEILLVTGVSQFLSAPLAGILSRKIDPRIMMAVGFALLSISTWMMTAITADWSFNELLLPQILRGIGLMCTIIASSVVALGTLTPAQVKDGSGLYNLMRNTGGALGLAGIDTMIHDRSQFHWNRLIEWANPGRPEVQDYLAGVGSHYSAALGGNGGDAGALRILANQVGQQSAVMAYADTFHVMAVMLAAAAAAMIFVKKPRIAAGSGGGGH